MAQSGPNVGDVGSYLYDAYGKTSANREDLANFISNVTPWDTPLYSGLGRTVTNSTYHEWLTDTLAATGTKNATTEGKDWEAPTHTAPSRVVNQCEIFLADIAVTETQREIVAAGFTDAYMYQVEKSSKEIMREVETALMADNTASTGSSATSGGRVMKTLEDFITTTVYESDDLTGHAVAATTAPNVMTETDFNNVLEDVWIQGGFTDLVVCASPYKRQISGFTANSKNTRYIAASAKEVVVGLDFYDSDFGVVAIQLNRFSPKSTNTATATASAAGIGDVSGRIWFLERAKVRLAELRPLRHRLMGTRGDSTVGQCVTELTLEVANQAALGVIKGVNNKSA